MTSGRAHAGEASSRNRPRARRQTRQRSIIQQVLLEANRPLSPHDILEAAQPSVPGLGIATVYRAIHTMMTEGALVVVEMPGEAPATRPRERATIITSNAGSATTSSTSRVVLRVSKCSRPRASGWKITRSCSMACVPRARECRRSGYKTGLLKRQTQEADHERPSHRTGRKAGTRVGFPTTRGLGQPDRRHQQFDPGPCRRRGAASSHP